MQRLWFHRSLRFLCLSAILFAGGNALAIRVAQREGLAERAGLEEQLQPGAHRYAALTNHLYAFPDLFGNFFDLGHRGDYGYWWERFLEGVRQERPESFEALQGLPVPEGYLIHGDLLLYEPTGEGFIVTGRPGAGKSLLSALLTGDPRQEWSRPSAQSRWRYLANDTVLVFRFFDALVAGLPPSVAVGSLLTRYRFEGTAPESYAGRVSYRTAIPEQQRFVPFRGILWVNRTGRLHGRRDLPVILGMTPQDRWSEKFQERMRALPMLEAFTPYHRKPPLRRLRRRMQRRLIRWVERLAPLGSPGSSAEVAGELSANLPPVGQEPPHGGLETERTPLADRCA